MLEKLRGRLGRSPDRYPPVELSTALDRTAAGSVLASWWVTAVGVLMGVAGAVGAGWGLLCLRGARAADNRSNPLREIGIAMGVAATLLGGLLCTAGIVVMAVAARRRRRSVDTRSASQPGVDDQPVG